MGKPTPSVRQQPWGCRPLHPAGTRRVYVGKAASRRPSRQAADSCFHSALLLSLSVLPVCEPCEPSLTWPARLLTPPTWCLYGMFGCGLTESKHVTAKSSPTQNAVLAPSPLAATRTRRKTWSLCSCEACSVHVAERLVYPLSTACLCVP